MYYSGFQKYDLVNGIGTRFTLYVSGCSHMCKDCFNKSTWRPDYGIKYTKEFEDSIIDELNDTRIVRDGLTLLGGDPLFDQNVDTVYNLMKRVKTETTKNVWLWTGYTLEEIQASEEMKKCLEYIDVLVDGKFVEELKDPSLHFRGSSNQRVLHKGVDF